MQHKTICVYHLDFLIIFIAAPDSSVLTTTFSLSLPFTPCIVEILILGVLDKSSPAFINFVIFLISSLPNSSNASCQSASVFKPYLFF